jgi:hypothetical protein
LAISSTESDEDPLEVPTDTGSYSVCSLVTRSPYPPSEGSHAPRERGKFICCSFLRKSADR